MKRALSLLFVLLMVSGCGDDTTDTAATSPGSSVPPEIDQLFDGYIAASNAYDVDAFRALITDDYLLVEPVFDLPQAISAGPNEKDINEVIAELEIVFPALNIHYERVGTPIVSGSGPWLVAQMIHATTADPNYPNGIEGISTITIVEEDGGLKVARDVYIAFEVQE